MSGSKTNINFKGPFGANTPCGEYAILPTGDGLIYCYYCWVILSLVFLVIVSHGFK